MYRLLALVPLFAAMSMASTKVVALSIDGIVHPITVEIVSQWEIVILFIPKR